MILEIFEEKVSVRECSLLCRQQHLKFKKNAQGVLFTKRNDR